MNWLDPNCINNRPKGLGDPNHLHCRCIHSQDRGRRVAQDRVEVHEEPEEDSPLLHDLIKHLTPAERVLVLAQLRAT